MGRDTEGLVTEATPGQILGLFAGGTLAAGEAHGELLPAQLPGLVAAPQMVRNNFV